MSRARRLILVRHAKAEPENGLGDHARPLSARGRRQAKSLGAVLNDLAPTVGAALVSDALRTTETFKLIDSEYATSIDVRYTSELYAAGPRDVLALLRDTSDDADTLLIVGHEPTVSTLASLLDDGSSERGAEVRFGVGTATAVVLEFDTTWEALDRSVARVVDVVRPSE